MQVWGPLSSSETHAIGAHAPVCTVVIRPTIPAELRQRLKQEVVEEVSPQPGDSAQTLVDRLSVNTLLDNPCVQKNSKPKTTWYTTYPQLNSTQMPQPRRATFSEEKSPPHVDEDGDQVVELYGYFHCYRKAGDDSICRVFSDTMLDLRAVCMNQVRPRRECVGCVISCGRIASYVWCVVNEIDILPISHRLQSS